VLVRASDVTILIDTAPDLRTQALRSGFRRVDAVIYTHAHADHTAGIDELRTFNQMQQAHIPAYATPDTAVELRDRFAYCFKDLFPSYGFKPDLTLHEIDGPFTVDGIEVTPIPIMHGRLPILGYRIGNLAYLTDLKTIPDSSRPLLEGLDALVITALRNEPHPAHMTIEEALADISRIAPRRAWLTHASHGIGLYEETSATLPEGVTLAADGDIITIPESSAR
jgi:phosphoribosyl 1,2-cyclic phosphate phosphodiesterase